MTTYRISFDVDESKLTTVISLLSKEVKNLVIRDIATINTNGTHAPAPKPKEQRASSARGPRRGGTMWDNVISKLKAEGVKPGDTVTNKHIQDTITAGGYNASSYSSFVTMLGRAGLFERKDSQSIVCLKTLPATKGPGA